MKRRPQIAIIGSSTLSSDDYRLEIAFNMGKALINNGYRLVSGGLGGVMKAAIQGARSAKNYREGDIISIIPFYDPDLPIVNGDIIIPTGLDMYRNVLVANSDAVISIGGEGGTLMEMVSAWLMKRLIIAFKVEGWSGKLADKTIDSRIRTHVKGDKVFGVETVPEAIKVLQEYLPKYNIRYEGFRPLEQKNKNNYPLKKDYLISSLNTLSQEIMNNNKLEISEKEKLKQCIQKIVEYILHNKE